MFQLTDDEKNELVTICDRLSNLKHSSYLPLAFTEQGIATLSGILNSNIAIEINIKIMRAFVSMRKFISKNAEIFTRLDSVERKQLEYQMNTNHNFKKIFDALETEIPKQGIFYDGQIFDAYKFVSDLIKSANKEIILIDNYIDESILTLFTKRKKNVKVTIYTKLTKQLQLDLKKFNEQYENIEIKNFTKSHDRFLIIDKQTYHFGASLKDLGKKWFAFNKLNINILEKLI